MKKTETIVSSLFGVIALTGMYLGQGLFVPEAGEKPVETVSRFAAHQRTFEVKASQQACDWALAHGSDLTVANYSAKAGSGQETEPATETAPDEFDMPASYHFVISDECADTISSE